MGFVWSGLVLVAGCGGAVASAPRVPPADPPRVVQPGAPGEPSRVVSARPAESPAFSAADVAFMQGMIGHHAQALEMTALLATRTRADDMKLLARRIDISQADEITMMRRWLEARGQAVPDEHAHHMGGALMPGMLTADEMTRLASVEGPAFDRLFLEFMIKHHDGALIMVRDLFAQPGAAQPSEIYAFAADVEADQSIEIERMRRMLAVGR
jgi:uncharacterized protein (DUF305 family)